MMHFMCFLSLITFSHDKFLTKSIDPLDHRNIGRIGVNSHVIAIATQYYRL